MLTSAPHPIIYHSLLNFKGGRTASTESTLGFTDLNEEAFLLVFAGSDTSSNTITTGTIHCIENRRVYRALKEELLTVWPNLDVKPSYETLEKLPYLVSALRWIQVNRMLKTLKQTAVVKESLRMSHGVVTPPLRVVPPEGATIAGHTIPGGVSALFSFPFISHWLIVLRCLQTTVGMSCCFVHLSETIFSEARTFKPERWLTPEAKELEPYLVAFSKGPRGCVGIK